MYVLCTELEVELPGGDVLWEVAILSRQSNTDLDDLQEVHITPHGLVMIVGGCLEGSNRSRDHPRELCVLSEGIDASDDVVPEPGQETCRTIAT